jgi:Zn-dependent protease
MIIILVMERQEINDILLSWIALSAAFMFLFEGVGIPAVSLMLMYLFIVAVSFLSHEFGHRQAARKYGFKANYEMWPTGILIAVASSLFGFLFAAPGAVVIRQRGIFTGTRERLDSIMLRISIAGIAVNLVLGAVLFIAYFAFGGTSNTLLMAARINIWLALFNLIPVPPLDGSKVLRYNKLVWIVAAGIAFTMFLVF